MLNLEPLLLSLIAQRAEIAELKEKLSTNSKNSSKPPSTDFNKSKKNNKIIINKRSDKKQGAQPGHVSVHRPLFLSSPA